MKGISSWQNGFSLYGKAGVVYAHHELQAESGYTVSNSGTHSKPALLVAGGMSYALTKNLQIIAEGSASTKNEPVPAMFLVSGGLQFIF